MYGAGQSSGVPASCLSKNQAPLISTDISLVQILPTVVFSSVSFFDDWTFCYFCFALNLSRSVFSASWFHWTPPAPCLTSSSSSSSSSTPTTWKLTPDSPGWTRTTSTPRTLVLTGSQDLASRGTPDLRLPSATTLDHMHSLCSKQTICLQLVWVSTVCVWTLRSWHFSGSRHCDASPLFSRLLLSYNLLSLLFTGFFCTTEVERFLFSSLFFCNDKRELLVILPRTTSLAEAEALSTTVWAMHV